MDAAERFTFVKTDTSETVDLECWRDYDRGSKAVLIMSAIWRDDGTQFSIWTAEAEVPFEVWEKFIQLPASGASDLRRPRFLTDGEPSPATR